MKPLAAINARVKGLEENKEKLVKQKEEFSSTGNWTVVNALKTEISTINIKLNELNWVLAQGD